MNKYLSEKNFFNKFAEFFSRFLILMLFIFSLIACMGCEPDKLQQSYNQVYLNGESSITPYKITNGTEVIYAGCLQPKPLPPEGDPVFDVSELNRLKFMAIPGSPPDLPPGAITGNNYYAMVLDQLRAVNPKVQPNDLLEDALIATIMDDPQSTRTIQTDITGNYKCRAILFSGKSVELASVELSGGVYCLGDLTLRDGAKIIEDSKAIGESRYLIDSTPFLVSQQSAGSYLFPNELPIPCCLKSLFRRTQLYNYREASVPQDLRNADFSKILAEIKKIETFDRVDHRSK